MQLVLTIVQRERNRRALARSEVNAAESFQFDDRPRHRCQHIAPEPEPEIADLSSHPSRVFSIDVLACPRCGGRMRILCSIHPAEAIHKILECLGLPSRPPPIAHALPDREIEGFDFS